MTMDILVSAQWLGEALSHSEIAILDATLFLPEHGRDARAEFREGHIPGARFLELETFRDLSDPRPSMLPDAGYAAARLGALGLAKDRPVVIYDNSPIHSAARAWWMLRLFGFAHVAIQDGGLAAWKAGGFSLEQGEPSVTATSIDLARDDGPVRTKDGIIANLTMPTAQLIDARGPGRFSGAEPEPRPGMASGHIPGSRNVHYARLFDTNGLWKRGAALSAAFAEAGVDLSRPVITTCGSGITAAVLLFGLAMLGKRNVGLYDGSWSEWGLDPATPKASGAAA